MLKGLFAEIYNTIDGYSDIETEKVNMYKVKHILEYFQKKHEEIAHEEIVDRKVSVFPDIYPETLEEELKNQ